MADRSNLTCLLKGNGSLCQFGINETVPFPENMTDPVREFWERKILQKTTGIGDLGGLQYEMVLYLVLAYVIIYFCVFKGIGWTGKVIQLIMKNYKHLIYSF